MTKKKKTRKKTAKKPPHRPRKPIDWRQFDKLCRMQCTKEEIAAWFECSEVTIGNRVEAEKGDTFLGYYKKKSAKGRVSLRRKQYLMALQGDRGMLVWLGKNILGQKDVIHQAIDPSDIELNIVHTVKNAET